MSKDKQYRAFLKSKYNHEILWTGKYYNTFKGAKTEAEKQRGKQKFENDLYTEIKVLLIEERIVTNELKENTNYCPMRNERGDHTYSCMRDKCAWFEMNYKLCSIRVLAIVSGARWNATP